MPVRWVRKGGGARTRYPQAKKKWFCQGHRDATKKTMPKTRKDVHFSKIEGRSRCLDSGWLCRWPRRQPSRLASRPTRRRIGAMCFGLLPERCKKKKTKKAWRKRLKRMQQRMSHTSHSFWNLFGIGSSILYWKMYITLHETQSN